MKTSPVFYHGSSVFLAPGTLLRPDPRHEEHWTDNGWYRALELHRPEGMLAHRDAVFCCDNPDDLDAAGGGTDWVFTVVPRGPASRHDMNWGTRIDLAIEEGKNIEDEAIAALARNYWAGVATEDPLWEYLAAGAKIIAVQPF